MRKGTKEEKIRVNKNFNSQMKGGLVMPRKILAGLVVLAFVFAGSTVVADSGNPLSYQILSSKSANNTTVVKLYLANTKGFAGLTIPLSFGVLGSDIQCTEIDFTGSRVAHFISFPSIDNENKRILIGLIRALDENVDDVLPPGEGLIATLHFSSKNSRPELKLTSWPLSAGKLCFNMVDEWGTSLCRMPTKDGDIQIPIKFGDAEEVEESKPACFKLERNYPNPFNPETVIKFSLAQDSPVTLKVYNILGQVVTTLVDEVLPAGDHSVVWKGKNGQGRDVASGVFFYRIKAGDFESIQKMTLLR
jgi:hypothetical protein